MEESTSRLRNGNGTSPASPALDAPCPWWVPASFPSKTRSSVATATATYRTPIHTPYLPIYIHSSLFYTAVPSPENFPSQLTPMLTLLWDYSKLPPHKMVAASPKYYHRKKYRMNKTFKRCTKDCCWNLKAMQSWVPTIVCPLHNPDLMCLLVIPIFIIPGQPTRAVIRLVMVINGWM